MVTGLGPSTRVMYTFSYSSLALDRPAYEGVIQVCAVDASRTAKRPPEGFTLRCTSCHVPRSFDRWTADSD